MNQRDLETAFFLGGLVNIITGCALLFGIGGFLISLGCCMVAVVVITKL